MTGPQEDLPLPHTPAPPGLKAVIMAKIKILGTADCRTPGQKIYETFAACAHATQKVKLHDWPLLRPNVKFAWEVAAMSQDLRPGYCFDKELGKADFEMALICQGKLIKPSTVVVYQAPE